MLMAFFGTHLHAQTYFQPKVEKDTLEPKANPYTHMIVYRKWWVAPNDNYGYYFYGQSVPKRDTIKPKGSWIYDYVLFASEKEALEWLNIDHYSHADVRYELDEIIGFYEIVKMKEIKLKLKTENKIKKKEVIVNEEKWTERHYEIKSQ